MTEMIQDKKKPSRAFRFVLAGLILMVLAVYGQVLNHDFINYDDPEYVSDNAFLKQGFNPNSFRWAATAVVSANWHPVTLLSHMLDIEIFGMWPGGHHLTNVLFHLGNTVFLFLVLRKMTSDFWASAFTALIFGIHPLHVESVAWVSERKDVLSTFFFMLVLMAYSHYVQETRGSLGARKAIFFFLALLAYALGLMSKSMLVSVPVLLLLLDYWPLNRVRSWKGFRGLIAEKIPFLILAVTFCVIAMQTQKRAMTPLDKIPLIVRSANAFISYMKYLFKTFLPAKLAIMYPHPGIEISPGAILIAIILLGMISFFVMNKVRNHPYLAVGWIWFLVTLVPVIGLVQVGNAAMADRYMYIPMIGILLMVVWGIQSISEKWKNRNALLGFAGAGVIPVLMMLACVQTGYWKNSVSLYSHAIEVTPRNTNAMQTLGQVYGRAGNLKEAEKYYRKALEIDPNSARALTHLGAVLANDNRTEEALHAFHRALEIDPEFYQAYFSLGTVYLSEKNFEKAIYYYKETLKYNSNHDLAYDCIGVALQNLGKFEESLEYFQKALAIKPDLAKAYYEMGNSLALLKRYKEAEAAFRQALKIQPDFVEARYNLVNLSKIAAASSGLKTTEVPANGSKRVS